MTFARVFHTGRSGGAEANNRAGVRTGTLAALGGALGGAAVLLAALLFATALGAPRTAAAPAAPASLAEQVGIPQTGRTSYEWVGRIDQDGFNFVSYGYLTYVDGLTASVLFSDALTHDETTARITFYATGTLTARSVISGITELNAAGVTSFYFDADGDADFNDPATFADGAAIGSAAQRSQNIINVQSPNTAVATNFGELVQQTAGSFTFGDQTYTFGRVGSAERSFFTGEGTRTESVIPRSFIVGAGNAVTLPSYGVNLPFVTRHD